jgi:lysophospholipase L1-like esterase
MEWQKFSILPQLSARAAGRVLAAAVCLVFLISGEWVAAEQTPLRIMPLGDSITQGIAGSYRRPLWIALGEAGLSVDFVGSMSRGYTGGNDANDYDTDHEGHWGWRADQVLERIDQWSAHATPDIVLIHLGTNDIGGGQDIGETIDEIDQIIERLRAHNPRMHVLLAAIIPVAHYAATIRIEEFNEGLMELAKAKDTPTSRVELVDHFIGFDAEQDTYDGIHPNDGGNQKMANRWFIGIQSLLKSSIEE